MKNEIEKIKNSFNILRKYFNLNIKPPQFYINTSTNFIKPKKKGNIKFVCSAKLRKVR